MGNQGLKLAAVAAVVLAVILGILAWRMSASIAEQARRDAEAELQAQQQSQQVQQEATTLAVVALRPLLATRPIGPDDVALKPVVVVPERYFAQTEEVVGRVPLIDIDAGAPVTPRYFRDVNALARLIPQDHKAMSLEITDVVAVGGFVRPGDEVDLLMFLRGGEATAQARILLPRVLVLAYEDRIIESAESASNTATRDERRRRMRTAVLAIPDQDITKVMLGASLGQLRLALHRQLVADAEADGFSDGSPLPKSQQQQSEAAQSVSASELLEQEQPITLAELSRLAAKKPSKPRPKPYTVEVFRGSSSEKVKE